MLLAQRELLVVFWVLATVRLEFVAVRLELLGVFPVWAPGLYQIEQNLLEDDQKDHERVEAGKRSIPVRGHHEATEGDERAHGERLHDHAVLVLCVLAVVLALDNPLDNAAKELGQDGHADGVNEDGQEHPPCLALFFVLVKIIHSLLHKNGCSRCYYCQQRVKQQYDKVAAPNAPLLIYHLLYNLTLPLIIDQLCVRLLSLDTSFDLIFLLV